eukprot:61211-Alexandrium_andersonii.AAC.1
MARGDRPQTRTTRPPDSGLAALLRCSIGSSWHSPAQSPGRRPQSRTSPKQRRVAASGTTCRRASAPN